MKPRERFRQILNFGKPDRLPVIEWAVWWDQTVKRWEQEGAPHGLSGVELQKYFDLDLLGQEWVSPCTGPLPEPVAHGAPIVRDLTDYEAFRRAGSIHDPEKIHFSSFDRYSAEHEAGKAVFWFTLEGFFWFPRSLLGIEPHLYAFYDRPELLHRMNQDQVDFSIRVLEKLFRKYRPEFMTFAEDLSYNHGPMLSRELFDEFLCPYYRQLIPLLHEHGVKVFADSDGDISECLGWFRDAGFDGILPLERMAGVDVQSLRERYPDMLFLGAFDKTVMHKGEAAIRREFERLMPVARRGGFIPGCDHQTPPEVSLQDYRLYLKLYREYAAQLN